MTDLIRLSTLDDGIVQLALDDPAHHNRLSASLCRDLLHALDTLKGDTTLKVLLLTGGQEVFCAGGSLEMLRQLVAGTTAVQDLLLSERLLAFPVPIIAALEGHAVGGGLLLALCCDILVASEDKRYSANFTRLGFTPGMGATALLPALVGHQFASEMLLTAKFYKGRELQGRGLFTHIVPSQTVMPCAVDIAQRMADKPRHVLTMLKDTLALPRRQAVQAAMAREHLMHTICFAHGDSAAALEDGYVREGA